MPPPGFRVVASTPDCPIAAFESTARPFFGLQFHPEVRHTPYGSAILGTFFTGICGARPEWTMGTFPVERVESIRAQAPSGVICGLSGEWTRA